MWDLRSINRYREALFDKKRQSRSFCSIKHSITGDIVVCQSHAFSRFVEAGSMTESEILGLFMAIMYMWDESPSKECPGSRESNTYEKSFFIGNSVLQRYCVPTGTVSAPCGYRVVFNKTRLGEGKREYCIFCIKKVGSRDLSTDKVHNHRSCYLHGGIPDQLALARKAAEDEERKRKREYESSEIRDLRNEVDRLRKRNRPETGHEYHYGAPAPPHPAPPLPPPLPLHESVPAGSYVYYAPPPGVLPPPNYPRPEPPANGGYSQDISY